MGAPSRKWVPRRSPNVCFKLVDRPVDAGQGGNVAYHGRASPTAMRARSRIGLARDVVRFCERIEEARAARASPVAIYMGMCSGAAGAMRACTRLGGAHTSCSRILRTLALGTHVAGGVRGADHPGRGVASRHHRPSLKKDRRRAMGERAECARVGRPETPGNDVPMHPGRGPLVARARDGVSDLSGVVPVRADGELMTALS